MSLITITPLDRLLNFAQLHLLIFSAKWKLINTYPSLKNFLGWDESEIENFDFNRDFLKPNFVKLPSFIMEFQNRDHLVRNFYWQNIRNTTEGPFETYFRITRTENRIKSVMAFIKVGTSEKKIQITPEDKNRLYISELLPGLFHNFNGPFGSMTERLERLKQKYPDAKELDEILTIGNRIKSAVENVSYKMSHERFATKTEIDLNRLLKEEIEFLNSDRLFKHQVDKRIKLDANIPIFQMHYYAISGIISETYYFFRNFLSEAGQYTLQAGTFKENSGVGFYFNLLGDFTSPPGLNLRFPFNLEGNSLQIMQKQVDGLDSAFLSYCLEHNRGIIEIIGRREMLKMRLTFSIPPNSGQKS
jgi:hypothetical protein